MGQQEKTREEETVAMLACGTMFVAGFVWLVVYIARLPPYKGPNYMVSITGVDGLNQDQATSGGGVPATLSPVFNLTVRVDNSGKAYKRACVWGLSTAVVSYGDAFLARGSVPPFCAEKEVQERVATAWGDDVVLPRFLRERLSGELERGEASLDVQVTMPAGCFRCTDNGDKVLVCNKVKIRGSSPSPCRVEEVYPRPLPTPAVAGSTS